MGTVRKVFIGILTVCMTACAGLALAGASCNDSFPDFINPAQSSVGPGNTDPDNRYTIKVQSEGGLALNGVQVNLNKNGNTVVSGISRSGEIVVYTDPDDYQLEVDATSLPAGYKVPAETVKTGEDKEVTVKLPSGVISTTASSSTRYTIGNILYDFSFTYNFDDTSTEYKLSELVSTHKAVVINFFFTTCGPCNVEFPYMQKAYNEFSDDVALVALADPSRDSATVVKNFAKRGDGENSYTFPMAVDTAGLHSFFQISSWPTTIVVDRYGAYVYRDSGTNPSESSWKALFARFASDNYLQPTPPEGNDDPNKPTENKKPTGVTESDYRLMPSQIAPNSTDKVVKFETETNEKDAEYNWPWVVTNDSDYTYLTASNSKQDPSFSIVYVELNLKFGDMVSFDYALQSLDGYDMFIVILDSTTPLVQISGDSKGWQTMKNIYIANADGHYTFSFVYIKYYDSSKIPLDNDYVRIKNISVLNVSDTSEVMDVARSIYHEGLTADNVVLNPEDGYYHIANTGNPNYDGALVLIDLWHRTPWSTEHTKSSTFEPDGGTHGVFDTSMYYISFWNFSNRGSEEDGDRLIYEFLNNNEGTFMNNLLDIANFSDNGYLPVNQTLQRILVKFLQKFNADRNKYFYESTECELTDWIEMCYFYQHYNSENYKHDGDEECFVKHDPIKGMIYMNAYDAVINEVGDNSYPNHVDITKVNTTNGGGGVYFKFTVPHSGVYLFDTQFKTGDEVDPELTLYRQRKLANGTYEEYPVYFTTISDDESYDALERSKPIRTTNEDGTVTVDRSNIGELTNAFGYVYLTEGDIIYVQAHQFMTGVRGTYDFSVTDIEKDSIDWLVMASDGMFVGILDGNGDIAGYRYGGITVGYDSDAGYFREQLRNGEFGSTVYIDFIHANQFDANDHSLEDMLTLKQEDGNTTFNLRGFGQRDYTKKMEEYIAKSKEGKDESDPLYGLLEADMQLVQTISEILKWRGDKDAKDGYETGYWKSVACYYRHIGN